MRAYLDPEYTTQVAEFILKSDTPYYGSTSHAWEADFEGDNTYYWRIKPRYLVGSDEYYGTWSDGWSFVRTGFVPRNLRESVDFATPTFSWEIVEGAESYDQRVDGDPNFVTPDININTTQASYTPVNTFANVLYYWRVRVQRDSGVTNEWTASDTFELNLPFPTGLSPDGERAASRRRAK